MEKNHRSLLTQRIGDGDGILVASNRRIKVIYQYWVFFTSHTTQVVRVQQKCTCKRVISCQSELVDKLCVESLGLKVALSQ